MTLLFSKPEEKHAQRLENVLQRFDEANLQLQPGKCVRATPGAILNFRVIRKWDFNLSR
jgi:hypothetical protein